jgi:hypothetical protein
MAEKRKRPRDVNQMAASVVKDATEDRERITIIFEPVVDDRRKRRSIRVEKEPAIDPSGSSLPVD